MFFYKFSFSHKFSYKPRKLSYKPPQAFLQAPASFPFPHSSSPALQSALLFQQPVHLSQSPQPGHLSQSPQPIPSANLSRTSSTSSPSISASLSSPYISPHPHTLSAVQASPLAIRPGSSSKCPPLFHSNTVFPSASCLVNLLAWRRTQSPTAAMRTLRTRSSLSPRLRYTASAHATRPSA